MIHQFTSIYTSALRNIALAHSAETTRLFEITRRLAAGRYVPLRSRKLLYCVSCVEPV